MKARSKEFVSGAVIAFLFFSLMLTDKWQDGIALATILTIVLVLLLNFIDLDKLLTPNP